jgi:hypothetical protein
MTLSMGLATLRAGTLLSCNDGRSRSFRPYRVTLAEAGIPLPSTTREAVGGHAIEDARTLKSMVRQMGR